MNKPVIFPVKLQIEQWRELQPMLLGTSMEPGMHAKNNRLFVDAVLYVISTDSIWSKLPPKFGNWRTAYMRFRRWNASGFWQYLASQPVQDKALHLMLKRIAKYGDQYQQQIYERQKRKKWQEFRKAQKTLIGES